MGTIDDVLTPVPSFWENKGEEDETAVRSKGWTPVHLWEDRTGRERICGVAGKLGSIVSCDLF